MGSDAAGCTDFGAIRQGQLGNNLGVAALICPRNKALRARYARGLARRRFVPPHIPSHLRNQQPLSVVFHDRESRRADDRKCSSDLADSGTGFDLAQYAVEQDEGKVYPVSPHPASQRLRIDRDGFGLFRPKMNAIARYYSSKGMFPCLSHRITTTHPTNR